MFVNDKHDYVAVWGRSTRLNFLQGCSGPQKTGSFARAQQFARKFCAGTHARCLRALLAHLMRHRRWQSMHACEDFELARALIRCAAHFEFSLADSSDERAISAGAAAVFRPLALVDITWGPFYSSRPFVGP
jgi:hypothetical protein